MNKKIKIFLYIFAAILVIGVLIIYVFYFKNNKMIKNVEQIIKKIDNISLPEPLSGPYRNISAENLDSKLIIKLTNQERINHSEKPLTENKLLNDAAHKKLTDMFENQYFEHVSPINNVDISTFVINEKYNYAYVGENLALGDFANEEEMVTAWMNSPGHRENILNSKYTQIGVAVKKGKFENRETWIGVQVFARLAPNCIMPDQSLLKEIEELENDYKKIEEYNAQINQLQKESSQLITEGNDKIAQGNKIYSDTKDKEEATKYWTAGESLYDEGVAMNKEANEIINIVNKLLEKYNNLKIIIDDYNNQIDTYNRCINI